MGFQVVVYDRYDRAGGLLTGLRETRTKRGQRMGFGQLEDLEGGFPALEGDQRATVVEELPFVGRIELHRIRECLHRLLVLLERVERLAMEGVEGRVFGGADQPRLEKLEGALRFFLNEGLTDLRPDLCDGIGGLRLRAAGGRRRRRSH